MPVRAYDVEEDADLVKGDYVWVRDDSGGAGVWRPGIVTDVLISVQTFEGQRLASQVNAQRPQGMTLDLGPMAVSQMESGLRHRLKNYRIGYEDYPYGAITVSKDDLRPQGNQPAAIRLAVEQSGTLVKWGTGTLTTGVVDTFAFATGLQIVLDSLLAQHQAQTGKFVLNIFAAIWSLPVGAVGVRQGYIAWNDRSYRSTGQNATMTATAGLNLASAVSNFVGSVGVLTSGDQALISIIGSRLSVGLWTVTQAIDFFKALHNIYKWYHDPLRDQKPISPDVLTAVKTFTTMVGGGVVTGASGLPQAIALAIAAVGSVGGSTAIHIAKNKVKQD